MDISATDLVSTARLELATTLPMTAHPERRLVWGAEHPELIITETLAFHDRRVKDEDVGGKVDAQPPDEPDDDFDQYLVPEGSLFIELYCVRGRELNPVNPANPTVLATAKLPMELYGPDGDDKGANKNNPFGRPRYLQLGRMAARNVRDGDEGNNSPIWRIAIQETSREADDATPEIERFIWFTRRPRDGWTDGRTYSNFRGSWPQVAPGGYVVVGPRPVTAIGYSNSPEDLPSRQRIILDSCREYYRHQRDRPGVHRCRWGNKATGATRHHDYRPGQ